MGEALGAVGPPAPTRDPAVSPFSGQVLEREEARDPEKTPGPVVRPLAINEMKVRGLITIKARPAEESIDKI